MKNILLLIACFFSLSILADSSVYLYSEYYGSHPKMRKDYAIKRTDCKPTLKARKIFVDETNELREIAYWDEKGKFTESHDENWALRLKVQEVFNQGVGGKDPCQKSEPSVPISAPRAIQE